MCICWHYYYYYSNITIIIIIIIFIIITIIPYLTSPSVTNSRHFVYKKTPASFVTLYLFSLMRTQDWVEMFESSDVAIVLWMFWLVEFPIIIIYGVIY